MPPDSPRSPDQDVRAPGPGPVPAAGSEPAPGSVPGWQVASGRPGTPRGAGTPQAPGAAGRAGKPGTPGRAGKPGSEPVVPSPHRRAPARFSWLGIALLGGAVVIALVVTVGIFLPALGALGAAAAKDPANLPATISVCGRDWTKDSLNRTFSRDEILARTDAEPIVVSTGPAAGCPAEVATGGDEGGMATVVYARVGDDAYVGYELVGGP